jgi:hypothetical protein
VYIYIEREREREREIDREVEKTTRRGEVMPVTIREQRYVSEPIESMYLKLGLLILPGNGGI